METKMLTGMQWLEIAAFVCVSLLIISQLWWPRKKNEQHSNLPRGSFGSPLIGETLKYMASMATSNPGFMAERRRKFGEMFKSKLMGACCIVTTSADTIKWVLAHDGKQFVTGYPKSFRKVLGEYTALSIHGEKWKTTRRFLVSSLRVELLKERIPMIEKLVVENLDAWAAKGGCVSIREETKTLAFNVVAQYLLGSRLKSGPVNDSLRDDFYTLTEGLFALPIPLPGTKFTKALEARARIVATLERDVVGQPRPVGDEDQYADYMAHTRKELPGITDEMLLEQTRCHVLGMLFAGHETTACAMLFAVKYIMDHPRVLNELRAEHDNIRISKFEDGGLTWDDFRNMRFTQSVITETLRLANPVALLWREATEDVQLNGYVVPKGWKTVCAIREAHHDPAYFEHPTEFNPWRHQQEVKNPAKKPPLLAFGGGPRYCPGAELARVELCIFLHHLVTKFDLAQCEPEKMTFFPIPKFSRGLQVHVRDRHPSTKISYTITA